MVVWVRTADFIEKFEIKPREEMEGRWRQEILNSIGSEWTEYWKFWLWP